MKMMMMMIVLYNNVVSELQFFLFFLYRTPCLNLLKQSLLVANKWFIFCSPLRRCLVCDSQVVQFARLSVTVLFVLGFISVSMIFQIGFI